MILARRVRRNQPPLVLLDTGEWVEDTDPTCEECGFVAKTENGLAAHERAKHGDEED